MPMRIRMNRGEAADRLENDPSSNQEQRTSVYEGYQDFEA